MMETMGPLAPVMSGKTEIGCGARRVCSAATGGKRAFLQGDGNVPWMLQARYSTF
jgi:hypothetical protein